MQLCKSQICSFENLPDPIVRYDNECRRTYVNRAWLNVNKIKKEDILGKSPIELSGAISSSMAKEFEDRLRTIISSGEIDEWEMSFQDFDENHITFSILAIPEYDRDGKVCGILSTSKDITERKLMEEKLKKKEEKFRSLAENAHDPIYRYDCKCRRIYVNPAVTKIFGKTAEELLGKKSTETRLVSEEDSIKIVNSINKVLENGKNDVIEVLFTLPDGTQRYYKHNHIPEFGEDGKVESVLAIGQDITAQKELASREHMFRTLAENSPNIIMRYDFNCSRIYVNPAYSKQIGIPIKLATNNSPQGDWNQYLNMPTMSASEYQERILKVIKTGKSDNFTLEGYRNLDGGYIAYDLNIVAERNTDGEIFAALAIGHNITERKNIEKRIEYMAHHDSLTGLPNRILVKDRLKQSIAQAKRAGEKTAVFFIDLDEFKTVNDFLGHSVGDKILQEVALRLKNFIRASDTLSRQGGDEFLLVLPNINNKNDIVKISKKFIEGFKEPFYVNNQMVSLSASIGISIYPDDGDSFESLLKNADTAMYRAKENGKNNYCFYTEQMQHNLIELFKMQNDMKKAIENREFVLHYQPQIDMIGNKICAAEALIRWQHPTLGMIFPMSFISIAESNGLIVEIGEWVIYEACRQASLWHSKGIDIIIAVNISAVQFKRGNLENIIKEALKLSGLNPKYLELELTESILIYDTEKVLQTVQAIKELGIKLSIDDFGIGYSSLAYLKRFAVDKLKIDQSFVKDVLNDEEDASIVKTIIQMAKSFNLISIAEGIENEDVLSVLKEYGCDEAQGYHFAKPMESIEFETYYTKFKNSK